MAKKEKKEKTVKMVSGKKLPGLFKKAYTEKDIQKKLISKLYVEADKKLVSSLFTEKVVKGKKDKLKADLTKEYTKKDIKHLKEVAKSIKNNKGRIRLVPLAAVAGFIAALVIVIGIFKNPVAKYVIVTGCEGVFGAKTTVSKVDVKLLGITIDVKGLSIGNKNSENGMKDLFDADIKLNVDLTSALRGKFVSDVISVTNVVFGRERTEKEGSCLLPAKAKKIEKEASADSAFMDSVKAKSENAVADLKAQMEALLGGSTPEEMLANLQSQIKSKQAAEELKSVVQETTEKWKNKPAELKAQAADATKKAEALRSLNIKNVPPQEIPAKIKEINDALAELDAVSKSVSNVKTDFDQDKAKIEAATKNLNNAIASDKALAENMVDTVKNAGAIMTAALDTVGYDMLGKYYPYVRQGINYALQMKNNASASSSSSDTKKKKSASDVKGKTGRMKGTTFWYKAEKPSVWVKLVEISGTGLEGSIKNISSNQDLSGQPTVAAAKFNAKGIAHSADVMLDARTKTTNKLITLGYTGSGFTANVDGSKISSGKGIPSISGTTSFTVKGTADGDGITASGNVHVSPARLSSDGFGKEAVDKYYIQALNAVNDLSLNYKVGFTEANGVDLALSGNYTDAFSKVIGAVASGMGADAKASLKAKIAEQTDGYSKDALAKVSEFTGISTDINNQVKSVDDMKKALKDKLTEMTKQQTAQATEKAKEKASSAATKATSNLLKGLKK